MGEGTWFEAEREVLLQVFVGHIKKFCLYSERNEEPAKDFKKGEGHICFLRKTFLTVR